MPRRARSDVGRDRSSLRAPSSASSSTRMQRDAVAVADRVELDRRASRTRGSRTGSAGGTGSRSASRSGGGTTPGIDASRSPATPTAAWPRAGPRCTGVGAREQLVDRRLLHDLARRTSRRTREHRSATTPRSWVTKITAMPESRLERAQQVEDLGLHGDVERGRGLVGDEQPRLARRARARAARAGACRPRAGAGSRSSRRSGSGMPTSSSSSTRACARLRDLLIVRCSRIVSTSCVPIVNAGFRLVIGSWNTIAISSPRTSRISSKRQRSRSRPSNITEPADDATGRRRRPAA